MNPAQILRIVAILALPFAPPLPAQPPAAPPPDELGRAFVTIPYSKLRLLWESSRAAKAQPEKPEP